MHHFFVRKENIFENEVRIDGDDFFHAVRVLRLKKGEKVRVSSPEGIDYICSAKDFNTDKSDINGQDGALTLEIDWICESNNELKSRVVLFQCVTKSGNMDTIIQKAVELGVSEIVPISSKNCVVRLDPKRTTLKQRRWQSVADASAKQSKRSIIPEVKPLLTFKDAVCYCESLDVRLIPYEQENGLGNTCEALLSLVPKKSIGVFIGPEGGFDPLEISMAKRHKILPISLGKRILRTDTAATVMLGLVMIRMEIASEII